MFYFLLSFRNVKMFHIIPIAISSSDISKAVFARKKKKPPRMHNLPDFDPWTKNSHDLLFIVSHYLLSMNVASTVQLMSRVWNLGVSTWFMPLLDWSHFIFAGFVVNLFVDVIVVLLTAWFGHWAACIEAFAWMKFILHIVVQEW